MGRWSRKSHPKMEGVLLIYTVWVFKTKTVHVLCHSCARMFLRLHRLTLIMTFIIRLPNTRVELWQKFSKISDLHKTLKLREYVCGRLWGSD